MPEIRVALSQINPTVGNLKGNKDLILGELKQAQQAGADIIAFPELAITGYPPEDLLYNPDFIDAAKEAIEQIAKVSLGIVTIIGYPEKDSNEGELYNSAAVISDGKIVDIYRKKLLPNYGVFDERRYFSTGSPTGTYTFGEIGIAVNICEDIWFDNGPTQMQSMNGADVIININASPYHRGKRETRLAMLQQRAKENDVVVCYVNLNGGQDELVFDGNSMVFDREGNLTHEAQQFQDQLLFADIEVDHKELESKNIVSDVTHNDLQKIQIGSNNDSASRSDVEGLRTYSPLPEHREIFECLVLGTRDYLQKNSFGKVVIGLSGGIDSALTAVVAVESVGASNVTLVNMPSEISSQHSLDDSKTLAENLGANFQLVSISGLVEAYSDTLPDIFSSTEPNLAYENIQARIRGNILMAMSNKHNSIVLSTGNKSEYATGYTTLYGDMVGGFAVLKDVSKTLVYAIAKDYNRRAGREIIPSSIITKEPSAELRPDQFDTDSLPPYEKLDPVLQDYIELNAPLKEIVGRDLDQTEVERVINLVKSSEYKRWQAPPGVKITELAFGKDRRYPIVNEYHPRDKI